MLHSFGTPSESMYSPRLNKRLIKGINIRCESDISLSVSTAIANERVFGTALLYLHCVLSLSVAC